MLPTYNTSSCDLNLGTTFDLQETPHQVNTVLTLLMLILNNLSGVGCQIGLHLRIMAVVDEKLIPLAQVLTSVQMQAHIILIYHTVDSLASIDGKYRVASFRVRQQIAQAVLVSQRSAPRLLLRSRSSFREIRARTLTQQTADWDKWSSAFEAESLAIIALSVLY